MNIPEGVYIGKDIEVAVTDRETLIFVKHDGGVLSLLAETADMKLLFAVLTVPDGKTVRTSYFLSEQGGMDSYCVKGAVFETRIDSLKSCKAAELTWEDGELKCIHVFSEEVFSAKADEFLTSDYMKASHEPAREDTLGECLNHWHLGFQEYVARRDGRQYFNGVVLNTPKHLYLYSACETANGVTIYTRAARYKCTNQGVVFTQNFRQQYQAWAEERANMIMYPDNRVALKELQIDESRFTLEACHFDGYDIYWSVRSFTPDEIILNGCGGDEYHWLKGSMRGH